MYTNDLNNYLDSILEININENLRSRLDNHSKHVVIVEVQARTEKVRKPADRVKYPKGKELPKDVKMPSSGQEASSEAEPEAKPEINPEEELEKIKQITNKKNAGEVVKKWLKRRVLPWALEKGSGAWGVMKNVMADLTDPELGLHRKTVSKWGSDIASYLRNSDVVQKGAQAAASSLRSSGEKPTFGIAMNGKTAKVLLKYLAKNLKMTKGTFKMHGGTSTETPSEDTSVSESTLIPYSVLTEIASHLYGYEAYLILQEANEIDTWKYVATLADDAGRQVMFMLGDNFIKAKWVNPDIDKEHIIKWNQGRAEGTNKKEAAQKFKQVLGTELQSLVKDLKNSAGSQESSSSLKDLSKKVKEILNSQNIDIESWINNNKDGLNTSKEARKFLLIRGHATKSKEGKLNSADITQKLGDAWTVDTINKPTPHIRIVPKGKVFAYINLYPDGTDVRIERIYEGESTGSESFDVGELTLQLPKRLGELDIEKLSEYITAEGAPTTDTSSDSVTVTDSDDVPEIGGEGKTAEAQKKKIAPDDVEQIKADLKENYESLNVADVIDYLEQERRIEKIMAAAEDDDYESLKNMGGQLAKWIHDNNKHIAARKLQAIMQEVMPKGLVKIVNGYLTSAYDRFFKQLGGPLKAYAKKMLDQDTYEQVFPVQSFSDSVDRILDSLIKEAYGDDDDDDDDDYEDDNDDDFESSEEYDLDSESDQDRYDAEIDKLYGLGTPSSPADQDDDRSEEEREAISNLLSPELDKVLSKGKDAGVGEFKEAEKVENFPILGKGRDWEYVSFNELFKYGRPEKTIAASLNKMFHDAKREGHEFENIDQLIEYFMSKVVNPVEIVREKDSEGHYVMTRKIPQDKIDRLYYIARRWQDSWFNPRPTSVDEPIYAGEEYDVPEETDEPLDYDDEGEEEISSEEPDTSEDEGEEEYVEPEKMSFSLSDQQRELLDKAKSNYFEKRGKMADRDRELKPTSQKASDAAAKLGVNLSGLSDAKTRLAELKAKLLQKKDGEAPSAPAKTSETAAAPSAPAAPQAEKAPENDRKAELLARLAALKKKLK